ncbi:hypothetical protein DFJ43DRAFT_1097676 [Lentinula guzmanii]|uniref:Uncharacterized protein n=1 Tax=Lentinula guzmanii TaxID=2804957 RepID=A0AA38JFB2_9AGAR|nr:hypothetical protein DFJ43DRAFT_1097676 [Lentinula guzmanii]
MYSSKSWVNLGCAGWVSFPSELRAVYLIILLPMSRANCCSHAVGLVGGTRSYVLPSNLSVLTTSSCSNHGGTQHIFCKQVIILTCINQVRDDWLYGFRCISRNGAADHT